MVAATDLDTSASQARSRCTRPAVAERRVSSLRVVRISPLVLPTPKPGACVLVRVDKANDAPSRPGASAVYSVASAVRVADSMAGEMLTALKALVLLLLRTVPLCWITEIPPAVATALVGTRRPVTGSTGASGRTVMATALMTLLAIGLADSKEYEFVPFRADKSNWLIWKAPEVAHPRAESFTKSQASKCGPPEPPKTI